MAVEVPAQMALRPRIEALNRQLVDEFVQADEFVALEKGAATLEAYDSFLRNVLRAHVAAPRLLAFLYAVVPPDAARSLLQELLEASHQSLLRELARGAGLGPSLPEIEGMAAADVRQFMMEPLLYGTLKEVGLAALCELVSFEYLLGRTARRIATALAVHRGLSAETLDWFGLHSEVAGGRAQKGLDDLAAYADYYDIGEEEAFSICEMTLRDSIFARRYFGGMVRGVSA